MNKQAFTLMELMVVVIIVGIMAAFAVPSYTKANNKAEERQMIVNLRSIITAQEIYKAQKGDYWPAGAYAVPTGNQGVPQLNTDLKLNIINGTKYTYACQSSANQEFECFASYAPGAFAWQLYTNVGIAHETVYPQQVCCDATFFGTNPCPTLPSCP